MTLGIACIIPVAVVLHAKSQGRKNIKKSFCSYFTICFSLLMSSVFYLGYNPFITCPTEYESFLTQEMKQDILTYNRGFYSANIPIFPYKIKCLSVDENRVVVETKYLYLGNTQMEIIDGIPSIIKPLN